MIPYPHLMAQYRHFVSVFYKSYKKSVVLITFVKGSINYL